VSYSVTMTRRAKKDLEAISSPSFEMIEVKLIALAESPRPAGCKMLKGTARTWRIRAGNYRVIYEVDDAPRTVTVLRVGHRKEIYR
jgi:mRNA interferase RelE/StbE